MKNLVLAALALSAAAVPSTAFAQARAPAAAIVVVDTDRIYRECAACRTAQTSLQSQAQALQTRRTTLGNQLQPEGQQLQTAIQALNGRQPDAALRTRVEAFERKQEQANQELARMQQNLQSIQAHVLQQINQRLGPAITQVRTARGANLAVAKDATLDNGAELDVTADVLAALNRALPTVSLTPLPQQQQQQRTQPQGR